MRRLRFGQETDSPPNPQVEDCAAIAQRGEIPNVEVRPSLGNYHNHERFLQVMQYAAERYGNPDPPVDLDPRWEWIHVPTYGDPDLWVKGQCKHGEVIPIRDISGELVARWCRTCDKQWTIPIEIR